ASARSPRTSRRSGLLLPRFSGLRCSPLPSRARAAAPARPRAVGSGAVVCEAQDTAVQRMAFSFLFVSCVSCAYALPRVHLRCIGIKKFIFLYDYLIPCHKHKKVLLDIVEFYMPKWMYHVVPSFTRFVSSIFYQALFIHITVPEVGKATWQSLVLDSDIPVLVDFWAPWCGPCRMIEPLVIKLSKVYEGKLKCYKLNTDENPDIASQYGIRSIPTMMIFKNGEKKDAVIGAVPESTLITSIEKFI
ncbi:unnamed protein product, partial [Musa banksii]